MDFLLKIWSKIQGWKTYFLGIGAIITAVGMFLAGSIDAKALAEAIWAALALMGLRHGITTTVSNATNKNL